MLKLMTVKNYFNFRMMDLSKHLNHVMQLKSFSYIKLIKIKQYIIKLKFKMYCGTTKFSICYLLQQSNKFIL